MRPLSEFEQIALQMEVADLRRQIAGKKEECTYLRAIYEASCRVLRYNGVDKERMITAVDELRDAIAELREEFDERAGEN